MRILHVIPSVSPVRGGPSVVVHTIARELAAAGVAVTVATTDDDGPDHRRPVPAGREEEEEPGVHVRYFPRQLGFYTVSRPLASWLERHAGDYDVIHVHALFTFPSTVAAWSAHRRDVAYVVRPLGTLDRWGTTQRRPVLKRASMHLLERRVLAGAAAVQWTTTAEREAAPWWARELPAAVIPNPVDVPERLPAPGYLASRHPRLRDREVILFLGRLDPKKGLELLLESVAALRTRHPEAALVVAGSGAPGYVAQLTARAIRLGLERDILWTGHLAGKAKWAALVDARVLVLASHAENFAVSVAEAMGAGTPVVISERVGIQADVRKAGAGLVVPRSPVALAQALERILDDPGRAAAMGEAGRRFVASTYSPAVVTGQLLGLYEQLAPLRAGVRER